MFDRAVARELNKMMPNSLCFCNCQWENSVQCLACCTIFGPCCRDHWGLVASEAAGRCTQTPESRASHYIWVAEAQTRLFSVSVHQDWERIPT